ncbi:MAG: AmmeMemoRadiSam system protein A [Candidatus Bipolaricaulota bacterium]
MSLRRLAAVLLVAGTGLFAVSKEGIMDAGQTVELTGAEQLSVLRFARQCLTAHLELEPRPVFPQEAWTSSLRQKAACFVTLTSSGELRGCILDGFVPHESIVENVARNVVLAATVDTRFPQVRASEMSHLTIEVSVLSRPQPLTFRDGEDLKTRLRPGVDGVILTTTYGSSTFLPQVWEQLPRVEDFLGELCRKHGAPRECWRTKDLLRVEVYQVQHFSEAGDAAH